MPCIYLKIQEDTAHLCQLEREVVDTSDIEAKQKEIRIGMSELTKEQSSKRVAYNQISDRRYTHANKINNLKNSISSMENQLQHLSPDISKFKESLPESITTSYVPIFSYIGLKNQKMSTIFGNIFNYYSLLSCVFQSSDGKQARAVARKLNLKTISVGIDCGHYRYCFI